MKKKEDISVPIAEYEDLLSHSQMLGRISCAVEPFCRTDEDTTYLAVRRLLADYYTLKADEAWHYLQEEEDRLEGKGAYIK